MDRVVRFTYQRRLVAHCSTGKPNVQIDWFFENGTKVGITDRNLREGHYPNGTTVLQIAVSRRFNPCDGGVYICVANDTVGNVERRNFSLTINSKPVSPIANLAGMILLYVCTDSIQSVVNKMEMEYNN